MISDVEAWRSWRWSWEWTAYWVRLVFINLMKGKADVRGHLGMPFPR